MRNFFHWKTFTIIATAELASQHLEAWHDDMADETASIVSDLSEEEIDQIQEILDESDEDEVQVIA